MLHIEIKIPTTAIVIQRSDALNYCRYILELFYYMQEPDDMEDLAAIWLYNKLRNKLTQKKIKLNLPKEYAMLLYDFIMNTHPTHELPRIAFYNILVQIDKRIKQ